jgi:hypothetical protein
VSKLVYFYDAIVNALQSPENIDEDDEDVPPAMPKNLPDRGINGAR